MTIGLNERQRGSDTWLLVTKYCEDRLAELRRQNDGDLDERRTARLRGRIAEIQKFLRAGEDPTRDVVADAE
jgi:hypothetical protein